MAGEWSRVRAKFDPVTPPVGAFLMRVRGNYVGQNVVSRKQIYFLTKPNEHVESVS